MAGSLKRAENALRTFALKFPGSAEEFPWGERVIKVNGKIFVFLGIFEDALRVGVKLPVSAEMALTLPFVTPTGYGLARAGWITARFARGDDIPADLLRGWIAQSYRAVAPRKLARTLGEATARPLKAVGDKAGRTLAKTERSLQRTASALRAHALGLANTAPWGKRFVRVDGKIFASIEMVADSLQVGVKLPRSSEMALTLPFVTPAGRSLTSAGWVRAGFRLGERPPVTLLREWIEQSYRTVVSKKPVKALGGSRRGAARS